MTKMILNANNNNSILNKPKLKRMIKIAIIAMAKK